MAIVCADWANPNTATYAGPPPDDETRRDGPVTHTQSAPADAAAVLSAVIEVLSEIAPLALPHNDLPTIIRGLALQRDNQRELKDHLAEVGRRLTEGRDRVRAEAVADALERAGRVLDAAIAGNAHRRMATQRLVERIAADVYAALQDDGAAGDPLADRVTVTGLQAGDSPGSAERGCSPSGEEPRPHRYPTGLPGTVSSGSRPPAAAAESIVCHDYPDCLLPHAGGAGGIAVHPPAGARISGCDGPLIPDAEAAPTFDDLLTSPAEQLDPRSQLLPMTLRYLGLQLSTGEGQPAEVASLPLEELPDWTGLAGAVGAELRNHEIGCTGEYETVMHWPDGRCATYRDRLAIISADSELPPLEHSAVEPAHETAGADPDCYTRADGTQDALWMKPHRDLIESLPVPAAQRAQLNAMVDGVYSQASEEARTENALLRALGALLLPALAAQAAPVEDWPAVCPACGALAPNLQVVGAPPCDHWFHAPARGRG